MTLNTFRRDRNYLNDESFNAIDPFLDQDITTQIDHLITGDDGHLLSPGELLQQVQRGV